MNRNGGQERGVGTVLTAGVLLVLLVVAWAASVVVFQVSRLVAAQDAADLAALAGAGAMADGLEPCGAAGDAAIRNDAELVDCEVRGDRRAFVVEVQVRMPLSSAIPGLPKEVVRTAAAGTT